MWILVSKFRWSHSHLFTVVDPLLDDRHRILMRFRNSGLTLLRLSAAAGIDVRILYPGKSDSVISDQASQSYFTPLLKAGASIYHYKDGFIHAKIVLVDDEIASIGTANMDIRSFELNYELAAVLYESETMLDIKRDFEQDFKDSVRIAWDSFQKRGILKRISESLMRLISPLL